MNSIVLNTFLVLMMASITACKLELPETVGTCNDCITIEPPRDVDERDSGLYMQYVTGLYFPEGRVSQFCNLNGMEIQTSYVTFLNLTSGEGFLEGGPCQQDSVAVKAKEIISYNWGERVEYKGMVFRRQIHYQEELFPIGMDLLLSCNNSSLNVDILVSRETDEMLMVYKGRSGSHKWEKVTFDETNFSASGASLTLRSSKEPRIPATFKTKNSSIPVYCWY